MKPSATPQLPQRSHKAIVLAIVVPFVLGALLTILRVWPATIMINWLTNAQGRFSLRAAIVATSCLLMLCELVVLMLVLIVMNAKRRARRAK